MKTIKLSSERRERIYTAVKIYWLSPFCSGTIQLGEQILSWALQADILESKAYADAYDSQRRIAYQIKTGLPTSPVTFARLTTPSQAHLVNSSRSDDCQILGRELLTWVQDRIQQPLVNLAANEVRVARLIYTRSGQFIYYERYIDPSLYNPEDYDFQWSRQGGALEAYRNQTKWFAWYPQGRQATKNQNQLHFHGENELIPAEDDASRLDFSLGEPGQISFGEMIRLLRPLIDD